MNKITDNKPVYILDKELTFNESERSITHYISTETVNRYGYILKNSGMNELNFRKNPIVLWEHIRDSFLDIASPSELVIGKSLWCRDDSYGVLAKTQFNKTELGDDIMNANKDGYLNSWSLSWNSRSMSDADIEMIGDIMAVLKWELIEYSSVVIPANPDCVNEMLKFSKSLTFKNIITKENLIIEFKKSLKANEDKIILLETQIKDLNNLSVPEQKDYSTEINKNIQELKNYFHSQLFEIVGRMGKLSDGITKNVLSQVPEIVTGAIRKHIGKVD